MFIKLIIIHIKVTIYLFIIKVMVRFITFPFVIVRTAISVVLVPDSNITKLVVFSNKRQEVIVAAALALLALRWWYLLCTFQRKLLYLILAVTQARVNAL